MIWDVLFPAAVWWLAVTAIGWAAVPIGHCLLPSLPDRGFALARPIGLVVLGYGYWIAGLSGLLPNSRVGAYAALGAFVAVAVWVASRRRESLLAFVRERRRYVLGTEALFLVVLVGWAIYRAYTPNIEPAGGEKYMEMAFINAILRSPGFPPHDPWLSGFAISYYYFGYLQSALLVLLTGLSSSVAFNLIIPTTLAMTCVAAFGLGHGMVAMASRSSRAQRVGGGALAAVMLPLAGSLVGLVELGFMRGWGPERLYRLLAIKDLTPGGICNTAGSGFGAGGMVPSRFIWWWRGSRVIHDECGEVIHEFPFFSFMLGDVHPHVMALPFAVLVLGVGLAVLAGLLDHEPEDRPGPRVAALALLVGALGFMNTWDLPTFGVVVVAAYGLRVAVLAPPVVRASRWDRLAGAIGVTAAFGLAWRFVPPALALLRDLPPDQQPVVARLSLSLAAALAVGAVAYALFVRASEGDALARRAVAWLRFAFWLTFLAVALYAPFYIGFRSQASGLGVSAAQTRPAHWFVHFGVLVFLGVSLVAAWLRDVRRAPVRRLSWLVAAASAVVVIYGIARGAVTPAFVALAAGAAAFTGLQTWPAAYRRAEPSSGGDDEPEAAGESAAEPSVAPLAEGPPTSAAASSSAEEAEELAPEANGGRVPLGATVAATFALGCVALGLVLALIPEYLFVRDLFNSRMNTVFKLFYQAWVLLAVGGSYALYSVWSRFAAPVRVAWVGLGALLVAAALVYPVQAVHTRTDGFALRPITLDGLASWQQGYPDDLDAARWLRRHADPRAVLVEAYGGAYEHNGRISMASGVPTILGWEGHEHQWRGTRENIDPRKADIERIYTTLDAAERDRLLDRYRVRYVVVSDAERSKFSLSAAQVEALEAEMATAFESPSGRLLILERR